jgi:hypothetical protein
MSAWKEFQQHHSEDFKRDSKESNAQMAKARQDLERAWLITSNKELIAQGWHNDALSDEVKRNILQTAINTGVQLAAQYGVDSAGCEIVIPEVIRAEEKFVKEKEALGAFVQNCVDRTFDNDLLYVKDKFQMLRAHGVELPVVRLSRKKTGEQFEYKDPSETILWFATQRRYSVLVTVK